MELAFNDLESLIRNAFVPQVLVVTTPEVEEACMKNKCQFIDFLHPYTSLETNITVKGIKEEPYIIQDFRIRFLEPSELRLTHELEETIEQQLSDQVKDNITIKNQKLRYGECRVTNSEEASNFLSQCKSREQSDYLLPWFHNYQNKFLQNIGVSEHEYFSHPVACIFVVTSHEDNSIEETPESFIKIYDSVLQMPGLFKEGFMDNNFLRYHILLKDGHSENENKRAELKLASLRQAFGANTCMLTINSHPINKPNIENNIISFLSNEDQIGFQSFTREFITKFIIPHIERKVQSLDEIVSANRRGLFGSRIKNLFRGFGGGGAKSKAVETPEINSYGAKIYSLSHPVSQMRQLADFVFFLRDYDNALVNYKNCLNDYKNDKSMKHWAGSLEMISICNSLLDIQRKESENDLEKVITTYFQESQYRFSTRVSFILVTMKKSRNRYLEAAAVCTRPENNRPISPLLSALFQEQAAFCYLYKQPFPMYRMFTMRLAIAADKYYQSGQYEHALGCTLAAYPNYQGKDWCLINSHLQYGIGREAYLLQDLPLSVDHFQQLLTQRNPNLKLTPEIQSTYLREFLQVLKNASDNLIKDVPIPSIKKGSVQVSLNSHYSQQGIWKQMEDWLVYENPREQARETFRNFSIPNNNNYTKHYASVVGERIYVWCEVENPLEVPLQLYSAQIVCDHFDPSDEMNADGSPVTFEQKPDFVLVEPKDIFLQPNTIYKLSLCIQPTKIGLLEIRSLAFNISGIVWGKVNFPIKTKKLHKTKEQRVNNLIETDYSLCIQVVSPMPLLEVSFPSLGPDLYHGEVKKFKISFKNIGEVALTNLKVKISHPSFFVFGPNEYLDLPFPLFSIDAKEKGTRQEIDGTYDLSLVHLPVGILKPKQSVDLILWVRGAIVGSVVSKFLFYYEPINIDQFTEMKYRVHKETSQFNVLPLFKSSILVNPSLKHINSYIFALEMQNTQPNLSLDITQISSVSSSWLIQPFNSFHSVQIQGSESVTIYSLVSMTTPHPGILLHTNTPIGKSNEKLIDSAAMPNYQFLVRSRRPHNLPTNTNFTYLNDDPPPPISSLVNINDSDFLIFWKTSNGNHHGFMDLQDISFLPIPPPPPPLAVSVKGRSKISRHALELKIALKSKSRVTVIPSLLQQKLALSIRNPIRYLIDSPANVFHDFADDFFCIVPIVVCITNPSQVNPITFKIEPVDEKSIKLENNDQSSSSSTVTSSKSPFFWVGITSQTVQNLEPGKEFQIPIRVGFLAPGIYNINRFRFSLFVNPHPDDKGNEPEAKQIFYPFEHLITIHSKGESITM